MLTWLLMETEGWNSHWVKTIVLEIIQLEIFHSNIDLDIMLFVYLRQEPPTWVIISVCFWSHGLNMFSFSRPINEAHLQELWGNYGLWKVIYRNLIDFVFFFLSQSPKLSTAQPVHVIFSCNPSIMVLVHLVQTTSKQTILFTEMR